MKHWILALALPVALQAFAMQIDTCLIDTCRDSKSVFIDTYPSPRATMVGAEHVVRFDSSWDDGSMVRVKVNGDVLTNTTFAAAGQLLWSPATAGTYDFEHYDGARTLTAQFVVSMAAGISNVVACQRYPWNGLVDLRFTVTGDPAKMYAVSFSAKDVVGNTNLTMSTLLDEKGVAIPSTNLVSPGSYRWAWNAGADLPDGFDCARVTLTGSVAENSGLYMVVDLSAGPSATSYPVSYLNEVPSGGWTDEYKTTKLVLRRIEPGTCVVTVTNAYYVGVFETTQKQYALFTGDSPSEFTGDMLPVEQVPYNALRGTVKGAAYPDSKDVDEGSAIYKLRTRTKLLFDLPTDDQWEYACRAGAMTTYSFGDAKDGDYMWYYKNTGLCTHVVGLKLPNGFGLYDMHGNVMEKCLEWISPIYVGQYRVARGGGFASDIGLTCSYRESVYPSYGCCSSYGDAGFRLVVELR